VQHLFWEQNDHYKKHEARAANPVFRFPYVLKFVTRTPLLQLPTGANGTIEMHSHFSIIGKSIESYWYSDFR
jgi:hypothetical protein